MRGVVARRRVAFFGQSYDRAAAAPLPAFLLPLRAQIAHWSGVDAEAFAMGLINEYRPGTPIGWHRDAPRYDIVAGISLFVGLPNEVPAVPFSFRAGVDSSIGDARDRAGPSIGVPDDGGIATGVRTSHSACGTVALLGDVSNAPLILSNGVEEVFAVVAEVLFAHRRIGPHERSGEYHELVDDVRMILPNEVAEVMGFSRGYSISLSSSRSSSPIRSLETGPHGDANAEVAAADDLASGG